MDLGDEFNNFILNELIDSSSSDDEDNFYCDVVNTVSETLLNELIHRGSIVGRRAVDCKRLSWHALLTCEERRRHRLLAVRDVIC
jgi:hypothetical protein